VKSCLFLIIKLLSTHIRPIGQALSPNGIGMSSEDVLSLAAIDYVEVDKERLLVTVGAGAKVFIYIYIYIWVYIIKYEYIYVL
jgi:hypothetical protein